MNVCMYLCVQENKSQVSTFKKPQYSASEFKGLNHIAILIGEVMHSVGKIPSLNRTCVCVCVNYSLSF